VESGPQKLGITVSTLFHWVWKAGEAKLLAAPTARKAPRVEARRRIAAVLSAATR
jgi:hypothetical protein